LFGWHYKKNYYFTSDELGIIFEEKNLTIEDVLQADESFFSGTAAEVVPINSLDNKAIGSGARGPITELLQRTYFEQVRGNRRLKSCLAYLYRLGLMRILIIGPSWVGDSVMAQSLYKRLKNEDPSCQIDVLTPSWSLPLLGRMPEVKESIQSPFLHGDLKPLARYRFAQSL